MFWINLRDTHYHVFRELFLYICIGDDSKVDTPVPISNTVVKHFYGENSVSEDSKLPIFFFALFLFETSMNMDSVLV